MHVRCHLDYGDMIYHDQLSSSTTLLESLQYNAGLIISGCWKGTNKLKLYTELGWESLANRRHCRRLCLFYKIINNISPLYLRNHLAVNRASPSLRYQKSFFPYCITHWQNLPRFVRNSISFNEFKTKLFNIYRPLAGLTSKSLDIKRLKLLTRLRCDFSDLREHRFRHHFNCVSPLCQCSNEEETTTHYVLKCPQYNNFRFTLFTNVINITNWFGIFHLPDEELLRILLNGSPSFNKTINCNILSETILYIKSTKRFDIIEAYNV